MATGRDDFVIAIRSAFLKKKDKQKFSLLTLIFLSIFVIVLSNFNFKAIKIIKSSINEVIYRSSFLISAPENYFKKLKSEIRNLDKGDVSNKNKLELKIEDYKLEIDALNNKIINIDIKRLKLIMKIFVYLFSLKKQI